MGRHYEGQALPLVSWVEELAAPLTDLFSRGRVRRWCRGQGYQLLRWRVARFLEGPSAWTMYHERYRIQVLDHDGQHRAGYLVFRRWWSRPRRAQVLWDEADPPLINGALVDRKD